MRSLLQCLQYTGGEVLGRLPALLPGSPVSGKERMLDQSGTAAMGRKNFARKCEENMRVKARVHSTGACRKRNFEGEGAFVQEGFQAEPRSTNSNSLSRLTSTSPNIILSFQLLTLIALRLFHNPCLLAFLHRTALTMPPTRHQSQITLLPLLLTLFLAAMRSGWAAPVQCYTTTTVLV